MWNCADKYENSSYQWYDQEKKRTNNSKNEHQNKAEQKGSVPKINETPIFQQEKNSF